jgi:hypothetical protein
VTGPSSIVNARWWLFNARFTAFLQNPATIVDIIVHMPHFFVDTDDGELVSDYIGIDARDGEDAARIATSSLPELAADNFPDGGKWTISVRDAAGQCVFKAALILHTDWPGRPSFGSRMH